MAAMNHMKQDLDTLTKYWVSMFVNSDFSGILRFMDNKSATDPLSTNLQPDESLL